MSKEELLKIVEQLDEIYSKLWDAGYRDAARAIDAVTDTLYEEMV